MNIQGLNVTKTLLASAVAMLLAGQSVTALAGQEMGKSDKTEETNKKGPAIGHEGAVDPQVTKDLVEGSKMSFSTYVQNVGGHDETLNSDVFSEQMRRNSADPVKGPAIDKQMKRLVPVKVKIDNQTVPFLKTDTGRQEFASVVNLIDKASPADVAKMDPSRNLDAIAGTGNEQQYTNEEIKTVTRFNVGVERRLVAEKTTLHKADVEEWKTLNPKATDEQVENGIACANGARR